jgi:hypothetical protein
MENERGTWPATPASPATSANEPERPIQVSVPPSISAAAVEVTRSGSDGAGFEPVEEDAGAETEIEAAFGAKLMDLRRLPRSQRPLALRAAREWRQSALKGLREKRARDRQVQHMLWRLGRQTPRAPG